MSVSYFVRYEIRSPDLEGFLAYYRERHVPVLARWPGLERVVLHTALDWRDPEPVSRGSAVLLAQLEFSSREALDAALGSPERVAARADFRRFPPFEGAVVHQAMVSAEAWRRA